MNRDSFQAFRTNLVPSEQRRDAIELVAALAESVPVELLQLWGDDGLRMYGDGLVTFVDPRDYTDILPGLVSGAQGHLVFARSAFANLFTVKGAEVWCALIKIGRLVRISVRFDHFGSMTLADDAYIEEGLLKPLFDFAQEKLGPLEYDECYGYSPAPVYGGSGSPDTLKRVDALSYLDILSQAESG